MLRVAIAFIVAPVVGIFVAIPLVALGVGNQINSDLFLFYGFAGVFFAYPVLVVLGIPAFVVLWYRQWLSFQSCLLVAMACAAGAWVLVHWPFQVAMLQQQGLVNAALGLVSALVASWLFWHIAIKDNVALIRPSPSARSACRVQ